MAWASAWWSTALASWHTPLFLRKTGASLASHTQATTPALAPPAGSTSVSKEMVVGARSKIAALGSVPPCTSCLPHNALLLYSTGYGKRFAYGEVSLGVRVSRAWLLLGGFVGLSLGGCVCVLLCAFRLPPGADHHCPPSSPVEACPRNHPTGRASRTRARWSTSYRYLSRANKHPPCLL